jgi:peptide/nickel transport system permease protein
LLATFIAAAIGAAAGYFRGACDMLLSRIIDLFASLPWIFLFFAARALLPLNVAPAASLLVTFSLMGLVGWASPARVVRARSRSLRESGFLLHARACGCGTARLLAVHFLPNLRPVLTAQFWLAVPAFVMAEAGLGVLGIGVNEPLPSLGNLLRELESGIDVAASPWVLAPAVILGVVLACFQAILRMEDVRS